MGRVGFWLASEGNSDKLVPHALYHVNPKGEIKEEIALPAELSTSEIRYGFEGVTIVGSGDDATLWMAVQREWKDDQKGIVKLVSYKPKSKEWGAVRYPLDKSEAGWVGLSEISAHGDSVYIIERDNLDRRRGKAEEALQRSDIRPEARQARWRAAAWSRRQEAHDFLPELKGRLPAAMSSTSSKALLSMPPVRPYAVTDNDGVG